MSPLQQLKRQPSRRAPTRRPESRATRPLVLLALFLASGLLACEEGGQTNPPPQLFASVGPFGDTTVTVETLIGGAEVQHPPAGVLPSDYTYTWSWKVDGVDAGVTAQRVPPARTTKHETWEVTLTADDGVGPTLGPKTAEIAIVNSPPEVVQVPVLFDGSNQNDTCGLFLAIVDPPLPQCRRPRLGATLFAYLPPALNAERFLFDADGDAMTTTYSWSVDGVVLGTSQSFRTADFNLSDRDRLVLRVVPTDDEVDGRFSQRTFLMTGPPLPKPSLASSAPSAGSAAAVTSAKSVADTSVAGAGSDRSSSVVISQSPSVSVSVSELNVCSIGPEGSLECTGAEEAELTGAPIGSFSRIAVQLDYACAIRADDQTIHCWGAPLIDHGQLDPPSGAFSRIQLAAATGCGLEDSGEIACWGDDAMGQASPPEGQFVELDLSDAYGCAVDADGFVACWGAAE